MFFIYRTITLVIYTLLVLLIFFRIFFDKEDHKRKRGKDKQYERFQKNGLFSQKHIRITESIKEKNTIKNSTNYHSG